MASAAVGAVSAVSVAASPASSGLAPAFGSKELHSSVSVLSFNYRTAGRSGAVRATARNGAATRAMQSRVSLAGLQTALISIGAARRVRVFAADGPQTAQPEAEAGPKVTKSAGSGEKSTFDIVCEVISEQLAVNLNELEANTKFVDLGADSLDTVEIMMNLEERFNITIEEDGTEKIATVKDAADLIDMVLKNK